MIEAKTAAPTPWTALTPAEKTAQVRQAVEQDGLSYSEAANALGATSRLAIAGVIERAKRTAAPIKPRLDAQSKGAAGGKTYGKRVKANNARAKKPRHAGFHKFVALALPPDVVAEPVPVAAVWHALEGTFPVPLESCVGCRFPIGDDTPFLSCNAIVKPGRVYCPEHCDIAYRELPPVKPRKETR